MNQQTPASTARPIMARTGAIYTIDLGDDFNRFTPDFLTQLMRHLSAIEHAPTPRAVVTSGTGKFFSTGLDLDWVADNPTQGQPLVRLFQQVLLRLLNLNAYTVAAVQGHCYGGGAMLALAHDAVVMRNDRGYFCLPEVDLPVPLTDGMTALISAKLPPTVAADLLLTGRRLAGPEALDAGAASQLATANELVPTALRLAEAQATKDPVTIGLMKQRLYRNVTERLQQLGDDMPHVLPTYPKSSAGDVRPLTIRGQPHTSAALNALSGADSSGSDR